MPLTSYYSIIKNCVSLILKISEPKIKSNPKIVKFLKKYNLIKLNHSFESIYIFSLIEYGELCDPKELICLFGNKEVIDAFKTKLYEIDPQQTLYIALDHILHTCRAGPFLELKKDFESSRLLSEIQIFEEIFKQQTHMCKSPLEITVHKKLDLIVDTIEQKKIDEDIASSSVEKLKDELINASQSLLTWPFTVGENEDWLERKELDHITNRLSSKDASISLILGEPGSGKSALLSKITNLLFADETVVLGIKADMLPKSVSSNSLLQQHLNLTYPIIETLEGCIEGKLPVLIIDQLDALSELVDRNSERLNVLLNLIQIASKTKKIHILCSCRWFEYQNDVRLTTIPAEKIDLSLPAWDDVETILKQTGFNVTHFSEETKALCMVPLHLKILLEFKNDKDCESIPSSLQGLLEEIWQQNILTGVNIEGKVELIEILSCKMAEDEELWIARAIVDGNPSAFKELVQANILKLDNSKLRIGFTHQTYFDFARARSFATGKNNLSEFVSERQDGLFIRPILLRALSFLRDTSRTSYSRELNKLWSSKNLSAHIRNLLIEYIGSIEYPNSTELACLIPHFSGETMKPLMILSVSGSPGWFNAIKDDYLPHLMSKDKNYAHLFIPVLSRAFSFDRESVLNLIQNFWLVDERFDDVILNLMTNLTVWENAAVEIVCKIARRYDSHWWIRNLTEIVSQACPDLAAKIVLADFEREYNCAMIKESKYIRSEPPKEDASDEEKEIYELTNKKGDFVKKVLEQKEWYDLSTIAETSPKAFIDNVWPWFIKIVSVIAKEKYPYVLGYNDDYCSGTTPEREVTTGYQPIGALVSAIKKLAQIEEDYFIEFFKKNIDTPYLAGQRLLCIGLLEILECNPEIVFLYLTKTANNFIIGDYSNVHGYSQKLISKVVPLLSDEQVQQLEQQALNWEYYKSENPEWSPEDKFKRKKWSREHRLRILKSFPKEYRSNEFLRFIEEEERAFPKLNLWDSQFSGVHRVNSPMSNEQMGGATDEHITHLFNKLTDATDWDHPTKSWDNPSGGSIQASREFASFAEKNPERASKIILTFEPKKQERPAGMGIEGLSTSEYPSEKVLLLIELLISKGFSTGEFRGNVTRGLEKIAKKRNGLPANIIENLKNWYMVEEHPNIEDIEDEENAETPTHSIIWGYRGTYSLPGGRDLYFEAIAEGLLLKKPPAYELFERFIRDILQFEKHPKIWQISFRLMAYLFNWDKVKASELFDYVIKNVDGICEKDLGIINIASILQFVPNKKLIQEWILIVSRIDSDFGQQAYGELLFLYNIINFEDLWGNAQLDIALNSDISNVKVQRGLAYGAAKNWNNIKYQELCTRVITAISNTTDQLTQKAIAAIFSYDQNVILNKNMKHIIKAILPNDGILIHSAENLVEGIIDYTSVEPELVGDICHRIIEVGKDEIKNLSSRYSMVAEPLVSISLTLHRMEPPFRSVGLKLFEKLIESEIPQARQALEILDRKPVRNLPEPRIRRRRAKGIK